MTPLSKRVARRFLAKGAPASLVPEFMSALEAYKEGNHEPITSLLRKIVDMFPGGKPPAWYNALGTAKRNALKKLYMDGQRLLPNVSPLHAGILKDPETWRKYTVDELIRWGKGLRTLEIAMQADEPDREIQWEGFSILPMPGVKVSESEGALEAFKAAVGKIRTKFPSVLYGKVFFSTHLKARVAAWYSPQDDTIHLNVRAKKRFDDVYTIIHEMGHRYDFKFLGEENRRKFWGLSMRKEYEKIFFDEKKREQVADEAVALAKAKAQGRPVSAPSPELVAWLKSPHGPSNPRELTTKFMNLAIGEKELHDGIKGTKNAEVTTEVVLHGPLSVTPYGATKPRENFAEAFAHYVLGMNQPPELEAIIADEAK